MYFWNEGNASISRYKLFKYSLVFISLPHSFVDSPFLFLIPAIFFLTLNLSKPVPYFGFMSCIIENELGENGNKILGNDDISIFPPLPQALWNSVSIESIDRDSVFHHEQTLPGKKFYLKGNLLNVEKWWLV